MSEKPLMPIEDVHTLLLYILEHINRISEKESIPIFSHGGTTLGAVRHKGFIPWDDDIDLIMERKYYERFVAACKKQLPDILALQTRENDPYFCEEYIKVCYKDEVRRFSELAVDVFILDNTDPDRKLFRFFQNKIIRWVRPIKLYKASREAPYIDCYTPRNLFKRILLLVFSIIPLQTLTDIQTKAMLAEKHDTGWLVDWGTISGYKKATWDRCWYSKAVKLPFENTYVYAPAEYEKILRRGYGDTYMQLPPVERRKSHMVHMIENKKIDMGKINKYIKNK